MPELFLKYSEVRFYWKLKEKKCYSVVRYGTVRYGTVRLVRRTEEEKYGMVRYGTDIWVVLLLPNLENLFYENSYFWKSMQMVFTTISLKSYSRFVFSLSIFMV